MTRAKIACTPDHYTHTIHKCLFCNQMSLATKILALATALFACVFVGGVTVVGAWAPTGLQGTAQGLFAAASGLATIVGSVFGGVPEVGVTIDDLLAREGKL